MPPAPISHPLFALFYQVEIRHRQLLKNYPAPAQGTDIRQDFACYYGNLMVVTTTNQGRRSRAVLCTALRLACLTLPPK
jgi:hypothetical protein